MKKTKVSKRFLGAILAIFMVFGIGFSGLAAEELVSTNEIVGSYGNVIDLSDPNPPPNGIGWSVNVFGEYTIYPNIPVIITGTASASSRIAPFRTIGTRYITLRDVIIDVHNSDALAFWTTSTVDTTIVNLSLEGENFLASNRGNGSGIELYHVNHILNIFGPGSLTVRGNGTGAGIGEVNGFAFNGTININSGTVRAISGINGVGIGNAHTGSAGNININGGTVTAISTNPNRAGIELFNGAININGGSVNSTSNSAGARIISNRGNFPNLELFVLEDAPANTLASRLNIVNLPAGFGLNGVYTDNEGRLFFWLPVGYSPYISAVNPALNFPNGTLFFNEMGNSGSPIPFDGTYTVGRMLFITPGIDAQGRQFVRFEIEAHNLSEGELLVFEHELNGTPMFSNSLPFFRITVPDGVVIVTAVWE